MKLKKSSIVLLVLAIVTLGLSVFSAQMSVSRTIAAINEIDEMKLDNGSMERFEKAAGYYDAIDSNEKLNLLKKVTNADVLDEARLSYARLMIRQAELADKKQDNAADAVAAAREAVDLYVPADLYWSVENYQTLIELEGIYSSQDGGASEDAGEAPPMC